MVWLLCTTRGDFFIQSVPLPTFPPTFHVVELIWFYRCVGRLLTHSLLSVFCCMSTRCIDCLLDRWRRDGTLKIGLFRILESSLFCVTLCTKNKSKTSFPCRWNKLAAMQSSVFLLRRISRRKLWRWEMNEGLYVPRDQTRHLTVVSGLELKSRNFSAKYYPGKKKE